MQLRSFSQITLPICRKARSLHLKVILTCRNSACPPQLIKILLKSWLVVSQLSPAPDPLLPHLSSITITLNKHKVYLKQFSLLSQLAKRSTTQRIQLNGTVNCSQMKLMNSKLESSKLDTGKTSCQLEQKCQPINLEEQANRMAVR